LDYDGAMNRHTYLDRASALRLEAGDLERDGQERRAAELREVAEVLEKAAKSKRAWPLRRLFRTEDPSSPSQGPSAGAGEAFRAPPAPAAQPLPRTVPRTPRLRPDLWREQKESR
jgi:hypothetical protein